MASKVSVSAPKGIAAAYQKTTLPNGIRIVSEEIPHVKSASIGFWIDAGSGHESADDNGIAHFLEHMVFKGTKRRTTREIARSLESVGGYLNAFTTKEHTCYYARVLDTHVARAIDVLADLVQDAVFEETEIEKEKKVVLEELKNVEDDPDDLIHDYFEKAVYAPDALSFPVLGTAENITQFDRHKLLDFVGRHYVPSNTVVAAAGNITHSHLVELVEKSVVRKKGNPPRRKAATMRRPKKSSEVYRKPIQQAHICTGTLAFNLRSRHRYPALVLNTLLGDGMSSRLFQRIRERYGFAYSVYSFLNLLSDAGSFGVYIGTDPQHVDRCLDLVRGELRLLVTKGISAAELKRTKEQLKGSMLLGLESTSNRMMRLGAGELYFGEFTTLEKITRQIDSVSIEHVQAAAEHLFKEDEFSTIIFMPSES